MIQVFSASNILEAHIVAGLLEQQGIACQVTGHFLQGAIGELPASDFAHVLVDEAQRESAEKLIRDYESGAFDSRQTTD